MKKILIALFLMSAIVAPAMAQTAAAPSVEASAAARELMDVMDYRKMMKGIIAGMEKNMPTMSKSIATATITKSEKLTAEQKQASLAQLDADIAKSSAEMAALFNDPTLINEMNSEVVALYARTYTVAELHQITKFYKSSVGTKMLNTMPQLMAESMQISQRVIVPRIMKLIDTLVPPAAK